MSNHLPPIFSAIQLLGTSKQRINRSMKSNRKRRTSRKVNSDYRPHKLIRLADPFFLREKMVSFIRKQVGSFNILQAVHPSLCNVCYTLELTSKALNLIYLRSCYWSPNSAFVTFQKNSKVLNFSEFSWE